MKLEEIPVPVYVILGVIVIIVLIVSFLKLRKSKQSVGYFESKLTELKDQGYTVNKHYINKPETVIIGFDENKKTLFAAKVDKQVKFFPFEKIIDCKININGEDIAKSSAANIVGGAILGGGIGALIGASMKTNKSTKLTYTGLSITFDDLTFPKLDICFAEKNEFQCQGSRKGLEEWHGIFKVIIERNSKIAN